MGLILLNAKYESLGYLKFAIIKDFKSLSRKKEDRLAKPRWISYRRLVPYGQAPQEPLLYGDLRSEPGRHNPLKG
jgi:hypothetical protein